MNRKVWNEAVVTQFMVATYRFPGTTEDNSENFSADSLSPGRYVDDCQNRRQ
jgi:hypothetical protein